MDRDDRFQLEAYRAYTRKKRLALLAAAAATVVIALYAAGVGSIHLSLGEILGTLFGGGDQQSRAVLLGIRLPRVASGILVGGILAASGAVMLWVEAPIWARRLSAWLWSSAIWAARSPESE